MMGHRQVEQAALFYEFSLERHIPRDHLLRSIDRFVELGGLRRELAPFYSALGRPSVDPELMIRMLIVGYCFGIPSERRLCEEVHLNLAYRWFCRLGLEGHVPDHSTVSKNRHGRLRDSDLLRQVFESVLRRCLDEAPLLLHTSHLAARKGKRNCPGSQYSRLAADATMRCQHDSSKDRTMATHPTGPGLDRRMLLAGLATAPLL